MLLVSQSLCRAVNAGITEIHLGMVVTVCGLFFYSYIKTREHQEQAASSLKSVDHQEEGISMIASRRSDESYGSNGNGLEGHNGYSTIELTEELVKG